MQLQPLLGRQMLFLGLGISLVNLLQILHDVLASRIPGLVQKTGTGSEPNSFCR